MKRVKPVLERARPVIEHVSDEDAVRDPECEIQVGEAVATVQGERAHGGSGDDALITLGELQHAVAKSAPLFNREHEPRFYFCLLQAGSHPTAGLAAGSFG